MSKKSKRKIPKTAPIIEQTSQVDEEREARRARRAIELERIKEAQEAAAIQSEVNVKKAKAISKRAAIYLGIMAVVALVVLFALSNVISLKGQEKQLKDELELRLDKKAELEAQAANITGPEYLEQQAREWLKMVKPRELMYVLPVDGGSDSLWGQSANNSTQGSPADESTPVTTNSGGKSGSSPSQDKDTSSMEEGGDFDTSLPPAATSGVADGSGEDGDIMASPDSADSGEGNVPSEGDGSDPVSE